MADAIITRRGGLNGDGGKPIDLPITIDLTEPTPIRAGHLWVKADIAGQITNVTIDKALKTTANNNTLQLIAPIDSNKISVSQKVSIAESLEASITMSTPSSVAKWAISNISEDSNIVQIFVDGYPVVYSKLNGVLDVETAYVWNGTSWVACSQKGSYITSAVGSIYNFNPDNTVVINKSDFALPTYAGRGLVMNSTGTVVYNTHDGKIYKRNGDIFILYQSLGGVNYCRSTSISDDGATIVLCISTSVFIYKDNGSSFTLSQTIEIGGGIYVTVSNYSLSWICAINEDCSRIYVREMAADGKSMRVAVITRKIDGTYHILTRGVVLTTTGNFSINTFSMYAVGTTLYYTYRNPLSNDWHVLQMEDYPNAETTNGSSASNLYSYYSPANNSNIQLRLYVTRDKKYAFTVPHTNNSPDYYDIDVVYIPSKTFFKLYTGIRNCSVACSSLDNTKLLISDDDGIYNYIMTVVDTGTSLTKVSFAVANVQPPSAWGYAYFAQLTPN